jgi:hypothetical protein
MTGGSDSPSQAAGTRTSTPQLLHHLGAAGGPHDPDATVAAAWLAAEAIRYLNYATLSDEGVQHAATLYSVAGALSLAADRIPQLASQSIAWLKANSGRLTNDDGSPISDTLADATVRIGAAAGAARLLALHLRELQNALAATSSSSRKSRPDGEARD